MPGPTLPLLAMVLTLAPLCAAADPALECSFDNSSQVEIADCVAATEAAVDQALQVALGFARSSAQDMDVATGRPLSLPALETAQAAWQAFRDAQCEFVGTTFGGGSGTGIAIRGCRIDLGRARVAELMSALR